MRGICRQENFFGTHRDLNRANQPGRLLGGELIDARREARFLARSGIPMDHALLHRLVEFRNRLRQQSLGLLLISLLQCGAQLLDLSAQAAPIRGVDRILARILSVALLC